MHPHNPRWDSERIRGELRRSSATGSAQTRSAATGGRPGGGRHHNRGARSSAITPATQSKDVSFHLLHKTDNTRIKQLRWCPTDQRALALDEIVRGYEYAHPAFLQGMPATEDGDLVAGATAA